jgi:cilia- and flagella-associated protein 298
MWFTPAPSFNLCRVGKNEKTKIVGRLQRKGGGPPVREPAVSEDERKAMMAWYFKKQEEEKALAEDKDDAYLQANWADPKALKRELLGTTSLGWKQASMPSSRK